jgi:hypothetical protein
MGDGTGISPLPPRQVIHAGSTNLSRSLHGSGRWDPGRPAWAAAFAANHPLSFPGARVAVTLDARQLRTEPPVEHNGRETQRPLGDENAPR